MAINTFSGGNPINSLQAAGKNKILNSDFSIWQRGTSFSNPASAAFTADRWSVVWDGSGATRTVSQQTFTPGTAPVTGYEGAYFYRFNQSVAGTSGTYNLFQNRMEDVRTFAGQTVTISFWGKAAATTNLVKLNFEQEFGTGGSPSANVSTDIASTNFTLTTSWQRFTVTTTVPSISGKTVGTTSPGYLGLRFWVPVNSTFTIDIWGVQVELGTTATTFTTATGTIQGELAACQRYYVRLGVNYGANPLFGLGSASSSTAAFFFTELPVPMRVKPTSMDLQGLQSVNAGGGAVSPTGAAIETNISTNKTMCITATGSGYTLGQFVYYRGDSADDFIGFSAEL